MFYLHANLETLFIYFYWTFAFLWVSLIYTSNPKFAFLGATQKVYHCEYYGL